MQKLDVPDLDALELYNACISRSKPIEKKTRLENSRNCVVDSCANYRVKAEAGTLFEYERVGNAEASDGELYKVYDSGCRKEGPVRDAYNQLMRSAPGNRCVLCFQREATELDHYLPRSKYQELSVAPDNLIPVCGPCNSTASKGTHVPTEYTNQFLHPYFDDFTSERWLYADTFLVDGKTAITFKIDVPDAWAVEDKERLEFHFDKLDLWKLFASNAAPLLEEIVDILDSATLTSEPEIRKFLREQAEKYHGKQPNSWKSAVYFALAEFDPFIDSVAAP